MAIAFASARINVGSVLVCAGLCTGIPTAAAGQCTERGWRQGVDVPQVVGHAIAYDSLRQRVVSFGGGNNQDGQFTDQTWVFNGAMWNQVFPLHRPPVCGEPRNLVYDSARDRVVKFSGFTWSPDSQTWEFDGADWSLRATTGPNARTQFVMAYDAARQRTVLFGGIGSGSTPLTETWEWDGASWVQRTPAASPSARSGFSMAYDAARQRTVLYGGRAFPGNSQLNDTWEWDGTNWSQRLVPSPPSAIAGNMVFDSLRSVVFMCGNTLNGFSNWAYDGTGWTQVPEPPNLVCPVDSASQSMAYMANVDKVLSTFPDGATFQPFSRSWVFGFGGAPVVWEQPIDLIVPIGGDLDERVRITCTPGATYRWRHNGNPLSNFNSGQTGIEGATGPNLSMFGSTVTTLRTGTYDCAVTSPCGNTVSNTANVTVTCDPQVQEFVFEPAPVTFTINFGGATYTFTFRLTGVASVLLDPSCNAMENPRVVRGSVQQMDLRTEPTTVVLPQFLGGSASLNNARLVIGPGLGGTGVPGLLERDSASTIQFRQDLVEPNLFGSFGYSIGSLVGSTDLSNLQFSPITWTPSMVPRGGQTTLTLPFTGTWTVNAGMGDDNPTFTMQTTLVGRRVIRCSRADIASLGGTGLPDGQLTADDIILFLASFFGDVRVLSDYASLGGTPEPDGLLTADDVIVYLSTFFGGCP